MCMDSNSLRSSLLNLYIIRLPIGMKASMDYKYSCGQCASCYVGSTIHDLNSRVAKQARGQHNCTTFTFSCQVAFRDV